MPGTHRRRLALGVCACAALSVACATPAELRKLQYRLHKLEREQADTGEGPRSRLADLGAQVTALQRTVDGLNGRLEVMERQIEIAVEEARAARNEAYDAATSAGEDPAEGEGEPDQGADVSKELQQYRGAYAKWRAGDWDGCIGSFNEFLAQYETSEYADDAYYWLGDCFYKIGNFSTAALRFSHVAGEYPESDKADDAVYRLGETLLRMGHSPAARDAFENLIRDYPSSARAPEARRQLELLEAG